MQEPLGWCLGDAQGGLAPPLGPTQDHQCWGHPPRQYDLRMKAPITAIVPPPPYNIWYLEFMSRVQRFHWQV